MDLMILYKIVSHKMMTEKQPNFESSIQLHLQGIAQSYIESHALHPKRSLIQPQTASSHLSMITKDKGKLQLTNPWFNIEDCLESL